MAKGRNVPEPDPESNQYTFPESGITVGIRKVSPLLRDDIDSQIRIEFPQPGVPIKKRNYGTEEEPDWIAEPDPLDPFYVEEMRKWSIGHANRVGDKLLWIAVRRGVDIEMTEERIQEAREVRADMAEIGLTLEPDDKFVYVTRVCIKTLDELRELHDRIFSQSRPSREAIEAMRSTFPGDLSGEGRVPVPAATEQNPMVRRLQLDGGGEVQ